MNIATRLLIANVLLVALAGCGGAAPGSSPPPSSTASAAAKPTPYQVPPDGSIVPPTAVVLTTSTVDFPARTTSSGCEGLMDTGWTGDCGTVAVYGTDTSGTVMWVVEHQPSAKGTSWVTLLYTFDDTLGWTAQLAGGNDTGSFASMAVMPVNLAGVGHPMLMVGARLDDTQTTLRWDLVDMDSTGNLAVIAGHEIPHAVIQLGSSIIEYEPQVTATSGSDPNAYTKIFLGYKNGQIVVTSAFSLLHRPTVVSQL